MQKMAENTNYSEDEKNKMNRELTLLSSVERKMDFPGKVEDDVKHHVIIYGP